MARLLQLSVCILMHCAAFSSPDRRWLVTKSAIHTIVPLPFGSRICKNSSISNTVSSKSSKLVDESDGTELNNAKQKLRILIDSSQFLPGKGNRKNDKTLKRLVKETRKHYRLTNTTYRLSRRNGEQDHSSPGGYNNKILHRENFRKSKLQRLWEEKTVTQKNNAPEFKTNLANKREKGHEILYNHTSNYPSGPYLNPHMYFSPDENEGDCSCFWNSESCGCECQGSLTKDDFQELARSFRKCLNFSFSINGGDHFSLPPNLFSNLGQVQNFHLKITDATFDYLFEPDPDETPSEGVDFERKAMVEISGVKVRRGWNWAPLQNLGSSSGGMMEIAMDGCGLDRISSDFAKVASGAVTILAISNSRLEMIGSGAFASFHGLASFLLPKNRLKSIHRTDFPSEPMHLTEIDLRDNQLHSLDGDLFTEMPSLQRISLAGNPLRMLSEGAFKAVIGKIYFQGLSDVPLYCDCHLRWLKNSTLTENPMILKNLAGAICRRPPHLRGTPFADLSQEHLTCK